MNRELGTRGFAKPTLRGGNVVVVHSKNGVQKQYRKPNNRKRRFNGKLRFIEYAVVPFGSGLLRESGGNRRGYGLGERRTPNKASKE